MKLSLLALLVLIAAPWSTSIAQTSELRSKVNALRAAGSFDSAIVCARELVTLQPDDPSSWYRMAYLFSLKGQVDSSLVWLDGSVTHGFADYLHFELDPDLLTTRSDPRFRTILEKARKEALRTADQKALAIRKDEWTRLTLEHPQGHPRVEARISFDDSALSIRATVTDDHFKDGERSWRYGDGFMVTLAVPRDDSSGYSDRFHTFGFSLEQRKPVCVLVNRDGTYFLRRLDDMTPSITVDTVSMTASYIMRVPWRQLLPFHPLLDSRGGFNIRYTSQGNDGSTTRLTYLENTHFDSERTPLRRFTPINFIYQKRSAFSLAGRIEHRLTAGDSGSATFTVWSPERQEVSLRLAVSDHTGQELWTVSAPRMVPQGRSMLRHRFPTPSVPGSYRLVTTVSGTLRWDEVFCRYDASALARIRALIERSLAERSSLERSSSLEALQYRLDVLDEHIRTFTDRDDPVDVLHEEQILLSLTEAFESNETIYGKGGYLLSAFRSPIDSSLQPYSIVLPSGYDRSKRYRLYVALHGSGVDEVRFAREVAKNIMDPDAIILAPRGRDLSGWWQGKDEMDVVELMGTMKKMLPVDRTLCLGFSMGGYGTWRMSMLHPQLFEAAAIISGTPVPPGRTGKDGDMRAHIGRGKELSYVVFHGTEDKSLPIDKTDEFVQMLKDSGYDIRFVRIQGAGHGNMDFGKEFGRWVAEKFLKRAE